MVKIKILIYTIYKGLKWKYFFGGVRGSIPTPGSAFSIYGGNTSCVEIKSTR